MQGQIEWMPEYDGHLHLSVGFRVTEPDLACFNISVCLFHYIIKVMTESRVPIHHWHNILGGGLGGGKNCPCIAVLSTVYPLSWERICVTSNKALQRNQIWRM